MIKTLDIELNAANPNLPLAPQYSFVNSPSSVRVRNAPRKVGKWEITKVFVSASMPDNSIKSAECVLVGGVWTGTFGGSTVAGTSLNGFSVTANGTDENGNAVTGYMLGKGDFIVLNADSTITVGETTYYVHLLDAEPATPHKGDFCKIGGVYKLYNGTAWETIGGSGPATYLKTAAVADNTLTITKQDDSTVTATAASLGAATQTDISTAVSIHDSSSGAHEGLFAEKQDKLSFESEGHFAMTVLGGGLTDSYKGFGDLFMPGEFNEGSLSAGSVSSATNVVAGMEVQGTVNGVTHLLSNKANAADCLMKSHPGGTYSVSWYGNYALKVDADLIVTMNVTMPEASHVTFGNVALPNYIESFCPYSLAAFVSGGDLAQGQIKNITLASGTSTLAVVLDFGTDTGASADGLLYVDASALSADATLSLSKKTSGSYTYVGEDGAHYMTVTKGKKVIFGFTRITGETTSGGVTTNAVVLVCKKEF